MWTKTKEWLKAKAEVIERMAWTAVQVVTAAGVVEWFDLGKEWVLPITVVLAAIKGVLAERFGNGSAATLPASLDPVPISELEDAIEEDDAA